jgi:hypothetical protein
MAVDTAVAVPGRGLYVFRGDQLWRFSGRRRAPDPGYPRAITAEFPGVFQRDLDAALVHPDGSLYLFRGDQHIRYSLHAGRPELGYPRRYGPDWPGVFPGGIDAALTWAPDVIYLFQGDAYTSFSPRQARARPGYPKPISGNWPGIHGRPVRAIFPLPGDRTLVLTDAPLVLDSEGGLVPGEPDGLPGLLQGQAAMSSPRAHSGPAAVSAFPRAYPDPFAANTKLQGALQQAIASAERRRGQPAGSFPVPVTIADVTAGTSPFPMAGHFDSEVDYIASEAKVPVMYAAFELRAMARRFAAANPAIPAAQILSQVAAVQDRLFLRAVPRLNAATSITDVHRRPSYSKMFTAGAGGAIDFTAGYAAALHEMIVSSSDADAATCVHGVGYSYLNGTLSAGGFISASRTAPAGIWVAGDYTFGHGWPYVRGVTSANDGPAAFAGTTRQLARMLTLISTGELVDSASSGEMAALLGEAAHGTGGNPPPDWPWTALGKPRIPLEKFVLNKVGVGPKGRNPGSQQFYSEVSLVKDVAAAGHSYVVAWQNLLDPGPYSPIADMAQLILDTLRAYE